MRSADVAPAILRIARLDADAVRSELPTIASAVAPLTAALLLEEHAGSGPTPISKVGVAPDDLVQSLEEGTASSFVLTGGSGGSLVLVIVPREPLSPGELESFSALAATAGLALSAAAAAAGRAMADALAEAESRRRVALAFELTEAREEERDFISNRVHDGAQQTVTSAALVLDAAVADLEKSEASPSALRLVTIARDRSRDAIRQMRKLYEELDDDREGADGLTAASVQIADRIGEAHDVRFQIDLRAADAALEPAQRSDAFAIVREAVVNAVKHANPKLVSITASEEGHGAIAISVSNDGTPMLQREGNRGRGLGQMEYRAASHDWKLSWDAGMEGTTVRLLIPGEPPAAATA